VVDGVEGCGEVEENEDVRCPESEERRRSLVILRRAVSVLCCERDTD